MLSSYKSTTERNLEFFLLKIGLKINMFFYILFAAF
jgi:hypothetical protein